MDRQNVSRSKERGRSSDKRRSLSRRKQNHSSKRRTGSAERRHYHSRPRHSRSVSRGHRSASRRRRSSSRGHQSSSRNRRSPSRSRRAGTCGPSRPRDYRDHDHERNYRSSQHSYSGSHVKSSGKSRATSQENGTDLSVVVPPSLLPSVDRQKDSQDVENGGRTAEKSGSQTKSSQMVSQKSSQSSSKSLSLKSSSEPEKGKSVKSSKKSKKRKRSTSTSSSSSSSSATGCSDSSESDRRSRSSSSSSDDSTVARKRRKRDKSKKKKDRKDRKKKSKKSKKSKGKKSKKSKKKESKSGGKSKAILQTESIESPQKKVQGAALATTKTSKSSISDAQMKIIKSGPLSSVVTEEVTRALSKRSIKPMTKEEWEKSQSEIRRVVSPTTGRQRLIRGEGEILEEIVSRTRHREINKLATISDGHQFQTTVYFSETTLK